MKHQESKSNTHPEPAFVFPENISEKVLEKWQHIKTKGCTVPGVTEQLDPNNLPSWWDVERIKNAQRVVQKDLYW